MAIIIFQNKKYKSRQLQITGWGNYYVASTRLERMLFDQNGRYKSEEAKNIDEQIFFYIKPFQFKLRDKELGKEILKDL